jgi:glycosyltransferase involved in cell wall biosynthesis
VPLATSSPAAPRVSVLIGVYDSATTLRRAIDAILAQTIGELELLLIDDGSTDASPQIISAAVAADDRVRTLTMERNVGIARSLNAGLRAARAPFVAVQDADDHSEPRRLERQLAVLEARREVAVVGSRMHEVDEAGNRLAPRTSFRAGDVNDVLLRFNPIPNTSSMLRRDVALGVGGYDPRYRYATEYDLWLRIADAHVLVALDEPLSTRVMGTANVAARAEREQAAEAIEIRLRALSRRRTLCGASGLGAPLVSWLTPTVLKRARRRRLGQAP